MSSSSQQARGYDRNPDRFACPNNLTSTSATLNYTEFLACSSAYFILLPQKVALVIGDRVLYQNLWDV